MNIKKISSNTNNILGKLLKLLIKFRENLEKNLFEFYKKTKFLKAVEFKT